jgi:2-polyprenyl-3-methyl-5-hydroxy-6-metoxy-1,4-benzoquinol methylase
MLATVMHNISLPLIPPGELDQDEAYFILREDGADKRIRFHDYGAIYRRPGLYEQLFYQRLRCNSPRKAEQVLKKVLTDSAADLSSLRVLDLGAGNGMVGELLDAARVVGVDIIDEARKACERDRPHAYDAYYVTDMADLQPAMASELKRWQFDCMTCIAALGFGDIPVRAFANAFNLVQDGGWAVFNIKETFMQQTDVSGFSKLIKHLLLTDTLEVHHLERYRHRISIDGQPLFYDVLAGRKHSDIPSDVIDACVGAD